MGGYFESRLEMWPFFWTSSPDFSLNCIIYLVSKSLPGYSRRWPLHTCVDQCLSRRAQGRLARLMRPEVSRRWRKWPDHVISLPGTLSPGTGSARWCWSLQAGQYWVATPRSWRSRVWAGRCLSSSCRLWRHRGNCHSQCSGILITSWPEIRASKVCYFEVGVVQRAGSSTVSTEQTTHTESTGTGAWWWTSWKWKLLLYFHCKDKGNACDLMYHIQKQCSTPHRNPRLSCSHRWGTL